MKRFCVPAPVLLMAFLLVSCSKAPAPTGHVEVVVTLADYTIESSLVTFHTGVPYRFTVTNKGQVAHELITGTASTKRMPMPMGHMHEDALWYIEEGTCLRAQPKPCIQHSRRAKATWNLHATFPTTTNRA